MAKRLFHNLNAVNIGENSGKVYESVLLDAKVEGYEDSDLLLVDSSHDAISDLYLVGIANVFDLFDSLHTTGSLDHQMGTFEVEFIKKKSK